MAKWGGSRGYDPVMVAGCLYSLALALLILVVVITLSVYAGAIVTILKVTHTIP